MRSAALAGFLLAGAASFASAANEPHDLPDSSRIYRLAEILVTARAPGIIAEPGRTEIPGSLLSTRDTGSAEAIAPLVPGMGVARNSRGETLFALRGASERQIALFLDGAPINVPWDERVDVSLIPSEAIGAVRVVRGGGGILDGPNALAGVVHLVTIDREIEGGTTKASLHAGEVRRMRGSLLHRRRRGEWSLLAAGQLQDRAAFLLPAGYEAIGNQPPSRSRLNSDQRSASLLLRLARRFGSRGSAGVSWIGIDAEKGVPPETHRSDAARFWRIPEWRRSLLALQGDLRLGAARRTHLAGGLALDRVDQTVQAYPDASYEAPRDQLDALRETGDDRTLTLRLRADRAFGGAARLGAVGVVRAAGHRERIGASGPELEYAQVLSGLAIEWEGPIAPRLALLVGGGGDRSETPKTGDKPRNDPVAAPVLAARLTWEAATNAHLHLKANRRTRFASLRELYSGAMGKFEPNPDLRPESQDAVEAGGGFQSDRADFAAAVFAQHLRDGIVRVALPNGKFQRRNEERIRTLGIELSGGARLRGGVRLAAHHTILRVRARKDGGYRAAVEGRPDYLSTVSLAAPLGPRATAHGIRVALEATAIGSRHSLDANTGRLARLPAAAVLNARLSRPLAMARLRGETYVRVDNLLDRAVDSQIGLPDPGREASAGICIEF